MGTLPTLVYFRVGVCYFDALVRAVWHDWVKYRNHIDKLRRLLSKKNLKTWTKFYYG